MSFDVNTVSLVLSALIFLCAAVSFAYGAKKYFKKGSALLIPIVVCAIGSLALGRFFTFISILTHGGVSEVFHVGMLGEVGCFAFFFSAAFGQMDSLVDGGEKKYTKYRLLPLAAPLVIALTYVFAVFPKRGFHAYYIVYFALMMMASYYNIKHVIFPDVDLGILKSIRPYNAAVLIFTLLCTIETVFSVYSFTIGTIAASILLSGVCVSIIPILEWGVKKWSI